jgi:hypothetical protein
MNTSTATFDDLYANDLRLPTADAKPPLSRRIGDALDPDKWRRNIPPDLESIPTSSKLEAKQQIPKSDTGADPDQNLRIEKSLIDWLEALSKVDDDLDAQEELRQEIESLSVFQRGWDGEGAEAIMQESIDSAVSYVENYETDLQFDAYPDPDGTVGLRADLSNGRVLLSFAKDGTVAYLIRKDKKVNRGHGEDHHTVNQLLETLL